MKKTPGSNILLFTRLGSDILMILSSLILAYSVKFKVGWIFKHYFQLNWGHIYNHAQIEPYLKSSGLLIGIWIITFAFFGLYKSKNRLFPEVDEWIAIFKASTITIIQLMAITIIYTDFPGSRFVIFYTWLFGIILLSISRFLIMKIEHKLAKRGLGSKRTLIIGTGLISQDIVEKMFLFPTLKLFYLGHVGDSEPHQLHFHLRKKFKMLGPYANAIDIVKAEKADVVFITSAQAKQKKEYVNSLIKYCKDNRIECYVVPHLFFMPQYPVVSADIDGLTFLRILLPVQRPFEQAVKRAFDIVASLLGLIICIPLFVLVYLVIKSVSPGPVFFKQTRTTKDNKPFDMIKFRTMHLNAEANGPVMVDEKEENRYIPIGQFLRKSSIDELPQLFNVLKGDMSIIGPRPERPFFNEVFEKQFPGFQERMLVKGGITGWAQINGRSVLTRRPEHKLKYDMYYIHHWSLVFDISILLKTIFVVFKREEAY